MKIVVFGANGRTGSLIVKQALEAGHQVVAYVRNAAVEFESHPNLRIAVGGLTEVLRMKDAMKDADVCISALGGNSLMRRSPEITQGVRHIISVMEQSGVPRFIYLSSLGAGNSKYLIPQPIRFFIVNLFLRVPLADHNTNEQYIMKSSLKWTLVRPGGLTDTLNEAQLKYGDDRTIIKGNTFISRANVAKFIVNQLDNEVHVNKAVWLYEQ